MIKADVMHKLFSLFLFLLFSACSLSFYAQTHTFGIPEIEHFNRRQYNAATQNWKITQGESDILYFANNDGLLEYDGENWQVRKVLGSLVVRSVQSYRDKIYTGSINELGYFALDSLHHFTYTSLAKNPELKKQEDYWDILIWNESVVFRSEKSLCIFKDDILVTIIPAPSRFVSSFVVNGLLLVHDETEGLMEIRGKRSYKISGGDNFSGKLIRSIFGVSDDKIIIGTSGSGLYLWDLQRITKWNVPASDLLEKKDVFCGALYENKQLIFGTIQGGLVISDLEGKIIMVLDKDKGLKNNTVLSILVDREGNIWGGLDNGIVKIAYHSAISFIKDYYDLGTGYAMSKQNDNYYFGSNQAVYKISETKLIDPLKTSADFTRIDGTSGQTWTLYSDNNTLLCGHNIGVFQINDDKARLITPSYINGVWLFKRVETQPNLLIAGTYNGLVSFEKRDNNWHFKSKIEGFNESSRFLEWDNEGHLWMSHGYRGVFKLTLSDDFSSVINVDTFNIFDFPGNKSAIVVNKINGECLFSSNEGLYTISNNQPERDQRFNHFFSKNTNPTSLHQDQYQNIWYFKEGSVGVLRYLEDGSYKNIESPFKSLNNYLVKSFEFAYPLGKENTFFGIENGFAHYTASSDIDYKMPFKVHIRSFTGLNDSLPYQLNQTNPGGSHQLVIPKYQFQNNSFLIEYAAPNFEDSNIEYSTFLSNYDETPLPWQRSSTRQFSKLPDGSYQFEVRAKNRHGITSEPIRFSFLVLPPWYKTIYAKSAYVALMVLIIIALIVIINKRIEINKQKEIIEQEENFRSIEDKLKTERLTAEKEVIRMRNEKLRNEVMSKEKELANSAMHIIQKNEQLIAFKDQLKSIASLDNKQDVERKLLALIKKIDKDIDNEGYWEIFETHLENVHIDFIKRLQEKHPELSNREQKLCAYIKMGMASKDIASLMNISPRAVENNRYHLRIKLDIEKGQNLAGYIATI